MKKISIPFDVFYYVISFFLFSLDICFFMWYERPLVYGLLSFYCVYLLTRSWSLGWAGFCALLLSFESFIYFGRFGIILPLFMLISVVGLHMRYALYPVAWHAHALIAGTLLIHIGLIEALLLRLPISPFYTVSLICANLIISCILSLKMKVARVF